MEVLRNESILKTKIKNKTDNLKYKNQYPLMYFLDSDNKLECLKTVNANKLVQAQNKPETELLIELKHMLDVKWNQFFFFFLLCFW